MKQLTAAIVEFDLNNILFVENIMGLGLIDFDGNEDEDENSTRMCKEGIS